MEFGNIGYMLARLPIHYNRNEFSKPFIRLTKNI
jgi:hypothetical protein